MLPQEYQKWIDMCQPVIGGLRSMWSRIPTEVVTVVGVASGIAVMAWMLSKSYALFYDHYVQGCQDKSATPTADAVEAFLKANATSHTSTPTT